MQCVKHQKAIQQQISDYNLHEEEEYLKHSNFIVRLGGNYSQREFRLFEVDERNKKILRFLLYYFNGCQLAESVFPELNYKISKNLLLIGSPGTGKTMIMQIFSDYSKILALKSAYENISITQMMNYYKINNHIDKYSYNEIGSTKFEGNPINVCLNDIGLETENQKSYGTSLTTVTDEFLYSRYEIYQNRMINYHLTSNLNIEEFKNRFGNRLVDRFKSFNVIILDGESRRK